jgi:Fe-S-cluster containining protein
MITPSNFKCKQCGKCCFKYTVKVTDAEIRRIEKEGYEKDKFAEPDDFDPSTGNYALRRVDDQCIFLFKDKGKYVCRIYSIRPKICKEYPFNESKEIMSCEPETYAWENKQ